MKMSTNVANWVQFQLYLITLSGYSPDSFTSSYSLSKDPNYRWQLAVDMIYRGAMCDLMNVSNEWLVASGVNTTKNLAITLAQHDPEKWDDPSVLRYWAGPEIVGTELCDSLIEKYDIHSFSYTPGIVCEPFIEEIETLFTLSDVGWSDAPLVTLGSGSVRKATKK